MTTILLTHALFPESFPTSTAEYTVVAPTASEAAQRAWIEQHVAQAEVLVSMFDFRVDASLLSLGRHLRLVANVGVGFNNIDVEAARQRGIAVTNTPDPVTEPTAELAMGLMTDIARGITRSDRCMRAGQVRWGVMENIGQTLYGKCLGIIGFGRIGQATARRAQAAGMRIVYHSRNRVDAATEQRYAATYLPLSELLAKADYVSLHTPLTDQTHHLVDASALRQMKPTAYLINTARGAVVDEQALVEALREGVIAGAALDVFEAEPRVQPGLLALDNVVAVPHIGTATRTARNQMAAQAWSNVEAYLHGLPLPNRVN